MKFILDEELNLGEKKKLIELMHEKGYSNQDISSTIELTDKDKNQADKYREIINKYSNNNQSENSSQEIGKQEDNTKEQTNNSIKDTVTNDLKRNNLINYFEETEPKAFEAFKNGIGNNINDSNFPFVKLMSLPKFSTAIGVNLDKYEGSIKHQVKQMANGLKDKAKQSFTVNKKTEELDEASSFGSLMANRAGEKIGSLSKPSIRPISKFIRAYNALLSIDKSLANKYIDTAKENSILCDPNLYKMADKDQINNAVNIDVTSYLATNIPNDQRIEMRKNLVKAIKNNNVNSLKTYNINGSDDSDEEQLEKALNILNKNPRALAAFDKKYQEIKK